MSLMCPIAEGGENQEVVPALTSDRVPTLNPESLLPQVVEAFLSSQIPNPKTARGYRRHILAALDMMVIERFPEIQPGNLMDFKAELMAKKTVGNATKSQALTAMRSFLEWGSALGGHSLNMHQVKYLLPLPQVKVITPHEIMSDKEVAQYLAAAKRQGRRDYALLVVALGSGVRVAELVNLDIQDIRFDGMGDVIHVRQGKGGKDRMVPVRKEVRRAVDSYLEETGRKPTDKGPLFLCEDRAMGCRDSWRLTTKSATRIVKAMAEAAGIRKRISPHALRHTFASATFVLSSISRCI